MLIILDKQVATLQNRSERAFFNLVVDDMSKFAPELTAVAGIDRLKEIVEMGFSRSQDIGFTKRGPTSFFIELMLAYGAGFVNDPLLPWVQESLRFTTGWDQMERADHLFDTMKGYASRVIGPKCLYSSRAAEQAAGTFEILRARCSGKISEADFFHALATAYPEKARYVGDENLRKILVKARFITNHYRTDHAISQAVMVTIIFAFGHDVMNDPMYPWVRDTLDNTDSNNPVLQFERLWRRTRAYLSRVVKTLTRI